MGVQPKDLSLQSSVVGDGSILQEHRSRPDHPDSLLAIPPQRGIPRRVRLSRINFRADSCFAALSLREPTAWHRASNAGRRRNIDSTPAWVRLGSGCQDDE